MNINLFSILTLGSEIEKSIKSGTDIESALLNLDRMIKEIEDKEASNYQCPIALTLFRKDNKSKFTYIADIIDGLDLTDEFQILCQIGTAKNFIASNLSDQSDPDQGFIDLIQLEGARAPGHVKAWIVYGHNAIQNCFDTAIVHASTPRQAAFLAKWHWITTQIPSANNIGSENLNDNDLKGLFEIMEKITIHHSEILVSQKISNSMGQIIELAKTIISESKPTNDSRSYLINSKAVNAIKEIIAPLYNLNGESNNEVIESNPDNQRNQNHVEIQNKNKMDVVIDKKVIPDGYTSDAIFLSRE